MTREERKLLIKDLCPRLPYYTELYSNVADGNWDILTPVVISDLMNAADELVIKPYLRPISSMTEEEKKHLNNILEYQYYSDDSCMCEASDWLLEHHFDFRGLIKKGLALEAPEGMYIMNC